MTDAAKFADADEQRLAEMGYSQDLNRSWSGFQNFAISFTIISILAGCFTTYGQAWNNGGPVAISWGWPIISCAILIIALCMSELVSKFPTAGGIYWWAAELGGPVWGWFTGWFNLIGLVGVIASVDYACATFASITLSLFGVNLGFINFADADGAALGDIFVVFAVVLVLHAIINIYSSHLVAIFNSISVWWHVLGVAAVVVILIVGPAEHQSVSFVFTKTFNNSGFGDNMYWFYVLPLGFLLTQYTITGFDASAHISEETHGASMGAAKGVWRSVFYSAVIGWILLLAITFAATDPDAINATATDQALPTAVAIFVNNLPSGLVLAVMVISTVGQLFCGMSCVTSGSRMLYAFSRDRAVPGWQLWTKLNTNRTPYAAVIGMCAVAMLVTIPALSNPIAFFAVVSITVIGLYIAYVIPIYLRLRKGDSFEPGPWNNGKKYKWMNTFAVAWVAIISVIFSLPFVPAGVPGSPDFDIEAVNYAPLMVFGIIILVGLWWIVSARRHFTGPVRTIDLDKEINLA
ncbi:MAG: hypothetical protein QOG62_2024 [Thermoleophilaceae bacterium]|jgi:amino acid transporter|nr:hypothetical protein [Thermoleophilaceae bacterium]